MAPTGCVVVGKTLPRTLADWPVLSRVSGDRAVQHFAQSTPTVGWVSARSPNLSIASEKPLPPPQRPAEVPPRCTYSPRATIATAPVLRSTRTLGRRLLRP